jgi:adenylate cyclase
MTIEEPRPTFGQRRLAAIMFTDIKDFSKKMQRNEAATMRMLRDHNRLMTEYITKFDGKVIEKIGDAFLAQFESAVNATRCAIEIQRMVHSRNTGTSDEEKIIIRVGIHIGDVMIEENDVFGDGVNIASRIQSLAEPGGINISGSVYEQVKNSLNLRVIRLGVPQLKNVKDPVKVYQVLVLPGEKEQKRLSGNLLVAKTYLRRKRTQRVAGLVSVVLFGIVISWSYLFAPPENE